MRVCDCIGVAVMDAVRISRLRPQASYLKESATRVRNPATLPFSTFMSILVTSATRRSRNEPAAVSTALRPASSHDVSLTPTTSTISVDRVRPLFCHHILQRGHLAPAVERVAMLTSSAARTNRRREYSGSRRGIETGARW